MARKNTKQIRSDSFSQFQQRKYKKKNSPISRKDGKDWTSYLFRRLTEGKSDDGAE